MFQLLIGIMLNNTEKTVKKFESVGGVFNRYTKRKFIFWTQEYCSFKFDDDERVLKLSEVYDVDTNTKINDWMLKIIHDQEKLCTMKN